MRQLLEEQPAAHPNSPCAYARRLGRHDGDVSGGVTADGCPVEVYVRLPAIGEPELVHNRVIWSHRRSRFAAQTSGRPSGQLSAFGVTAGSWATASPVTRGCKAATPRQKALDRCGRAR
jgi:hypothetical protein